MDRKNKRPANAFDSPEGYSGQEYHVDRERAEGKRHPSGEVDPNADRASNDEQSTAIPPQNGRRAFFDGETGMVQGSGVGAGGGNPGEDFASDSQAGSGQLPTKNGTQDDTETSE